jgi:hypothetical protein
MTSWEKGRVQGKKDYISIETGDSKQGRGRINQPLKS